MAGKTADRTGKTAETSGKAAAAVTVLFIAAVAMGAVLGVLGLLPAGAEAADAHVMATVTVNPFVYGIELDQGWNLLSPVLRPMETDGDRSIGLRRGWNLIGYSSEKPLPWDDVLVSNGMDEMGVNEASRPPYEWLQYNIYYYKNGYKLIPGPDPYLREARGYWVYCLQDGLTLTLPDAGGSLMGNDFYWLDANATDGEVEKTISQAHDDGWLQLTVYYLDEDLQGYQLVPRDSPDIDAWRGYWLYAKQPGLELLLES